MMQAFQNSQFAALVGKAITTQVEDDARSREIMASLNNLREFTRASADSLKDDGTGGSVSDKDSRDVPTRVADYQAKKLEATEQLERIFRSDFAGFFLYQQLSAFQALQQLIKECTVHLVTAEKKGNVLYCYFHITIVDTKTNAPIFWDRELFLVSSTQRTIMIVTSAPSLDRRSASAAWITTWLSSLRVPLE